ncbi:hypothetical protein ABTM33_18830, partial [Acinetobacter baumannii]
LFPLARQDSRPVPRWAKAACVLDCRGSCTMRIANVIFASLIVSAMFGAAIANSGEAGWRPRVERSALNTSKTWLWQPAMRRTGP